MNTAGIPLMPNFTARFWFSSTFTLPTLTRPLYSPANSSREGAIILHGPHHGAQKSSITGVAEDVTSCPKFCSSIVTIFPATTFSAIFPPNKIARIHQRLAVRDQQNAHE